MKRLLFVVFPLLVVSLMVVAQATAQEDDACTHDEATVEALRECVEHAIAMGHIDANVAPSLLAMLDAAQGAVDRGQDGVAVTLLMAFIREVEAQAGKRIPEEHASHLIAHAQDVIDELST
jgi:hypothetical protein